MKARFILTWVIMAGFVFIVYWGIPMLTPLRYIASQNLVQGNSINHKDILENLIVSQGIEQSTELQEQEKNKVKITHINTPEAVKAIYMTSWTAGNPKFRSKLIELVNTTELNAIVIDIKDYSGKIAFEIDNSYLKDIGAMQKRIPDIAAFISTLHEQNIYVIGRITVFQDPYLASKKPKLAVKLASNKEELWQDRKGLSWLDPGAQEVWDYIVTLSLESYNIGFDELNFDYIRFPSDGNMNDIYYPTSGKRAKAEVLREFFIYLNEKLKDSGVLLSADLFGMTATNPDDLNIGQYIEHALPYFDFISLMVYPSHFQKGWNGIDDPAKKPYEVVKYSMTRAVERTLAAGDDSLKLRPWLQDFDLGAKYTAPMVRAQIEAVYDSGLTSWMLWDPANIYTREALKAN